MSLLFAVALLLNSNGAFAARNEHRPVCSPDGLQMVYMLKSEHTKDDWELYLMELDSQVSSRLTFHAGWDGYAVWSADGKQIIFDREDAPDGKKQPWIMDMERNTSKPLGNYEGQVSVSDWSADNRLLAFQELDGQRDLVLLDTEGNIVLKITDTPEYSEHDAHFSPDGRTIAYANGGIDGSETSLELINIDDGSKTVLRTSIGRIYGISWSPDGNEIAFVDAPAGDDDDADIFIYNLTDQSYKQVTVDPAWDHMPEFCNSSHTLYFTSDRSGEERIYKIDPDPTPFLSIKRAND